MAHFPNVRDAFRQRGTPLRDRLAISTDESKGHALGSSAATAHALNKRRQAERAGDSRS